MPLHGSSTIRGQGSTYGVRSATAGPPDEAAPDAVGPNAVVVFGPTCKAFISCSWMGIGITPSGPKLIWSTDSSVTTGMSGGRTGRPCCRRSSIHVSESRSGYQRNPAGASGSSATVSKTENGREFPFPQHCGPRYQNWFPFAWRKFIRDGFRIFAKSYDQFFLTFCYSTVCYSCICL